jgi:hypothetical protein
MIKTILKIRLKKYGFSSFFQSLRNFLFDFILINFFIIKKPYEIDEIWKVIAHLAI